LASAVNSQQRAGLDQLGGLGQDLFAVNAPRVQANSVNAGSGAVSANISDVSELTNSDYQLVYSGSAYSLRRASDGSNLPLTGSGTVADPYKAEGLSLVVSGTPAANDSFLIRPTYEAASTLRTAVTDPRLIATSAPIRASTVAGNAGNGTITAGEVLDSGNANLQTTTVIQFTSPNTYSVNGSGSFAYTAGANIDVNGWRVQISGAPVVGDSFKVERNAAGSADNRNALLLAGLQNKGVLSGNTATLNDAVGSLIGSVGTQARQTDIARTAQAAVTDSARQQVQSTAGVNLDEEAANLLRWQQAYQAAAQAITIANTLFQSLLQIGR
jgi:flagellar hook-associated protein 1 FlgK